MKVEINENNPIRKKLGNEYFTTFCIIYKLILAHIHLQCLHIHLISKMNKFIENLTKLFNKATSFSCHKKNNAIVLDNPNSGEHLPQFGFWDLKKRCIVSPTRNANKLQGSKKWRMSNETFLKWWIVHIQPSVMKPRCLWGNHRAKNKI